MPVTAGENGEDADAGRLELGTNVAIGTARPLC
jgi:hypothetical protein